MATKFKKTAVAQAAEQVVTQACRALQPVRHDGDDYAPGEVIELTPVDAEALLASNAVELEAATLPDLPAA
jgi:hypothetical protein